jgi:hypothetical protein
VEAGELANHSLRCEITPNVLRSPDAFVDYLVSMASQTVSLVRQFEDLGSGGLRSLVEQPVEEYLAFVVDTYEVAMADVDLSAIVQSVVQGFAGLDFSVTPTERAL